MGRKKGKPPVRAFIYRNGDAHFLKDPTDDTWLHVDGHKRWFVYVHYTTRYARLFYVER